MHEIWVVALLTIWVKQGGKTQGGAIGPEKCHESQKSKIEYVM